MPIHSFRTHLEAVRNANPGKRFSYRPHHGPGSCERRIRQEGKIIAKRTLRETLERACGNAPWFDTADFESILLVRL